MTNTFQAITKAADHIEANPDLFNYGRCYVPKHCGMPGCALGWINFFSGTGQEVCAVDGIQVISAAPLGFSQSDALSFYKRMDGLANDFGQWRYSAAICARTLRLYAETYHASERLPEKLPVWLSMRDREAKAYAKFREKLVLEPLDDTRLTKRA